MCKEDNIFGYWVQNEFNLNCNVQCLFLHNTLETQVEKKSNSKQFVNFKDITIKIMPQIS